jgi:predicted MFS family arabinose efflux permease
MGIRQSAQPLGVAVAALTLPIFAEYGRSGALVFLGVFCLAAAALVVALVRDPPAPRTQPRGSGGSPYRTPMLWRIHAASSLLVVPQFTVVTFALVFLVDTRGWPAAEAGRLLAVTALGGAAVRLLAGYWSDRVGSRMGPMRILAVATGLIVLAVAAGAATGSSLAVVALLVAAVAVVSTNGLAFTAVAEQAGSSWAGRALGIQNTGQNAFAAATPPVVAAAIGAAGYPAVFAAVALFPLAAAVLVPVAAEGSPRGLPVTRQDVS